MISFLLLADRSLVLELLFFPHIPGCRKYKINDLIDFSVFFWTQDLPNLLNNMRIFKLFLYGHKTHNGVNANRSDIPSVSRAADLCLPSPAKPTIAWMCFEANSSFCDFQRDASDMVLT